MVNIKKVGATFGMLVSLAFLIHGCGGGGGGGNNNPSGTASQSAAASSKAIISALGAASTGANPSINKPFLKAQAPNTSDQAQVRQALKDFKASLAARKKTRQTVDTIESECTTGTGSIQMDDNNTPEDFSDDSFTQTFNDCAQSFEGITLVQDGSMTLTTSNGGDNFTMTFDNFSVQSSDSSATFEFISDGTMSFAGTNVDCGENTFLESGVFTMDFTSISRVDLGSDGTFETDDSSVMDNLTMTIAETHGDEPDCNLISSTFTMDGGSSFTSANAENNFTATFDDFEVTLTPEVRNGVAGDVISMSGTISVDTDCSSGTFTISTPAGDEPFIPEDGSCPTDGRFVVTSGSTTAAVIFTSTGGVQIDEGNDGSIEQTFDDCEASDVCSSAEV